MAFSELETFKYTTARKEAPKTGRDAMIGSKIRRVGLVPDSSRMSKRSEGSSKSSYLASSTCAFLCLSPFRGVVQLIVVMWRQSEFTDSDPLFFFH